MEDPGVPSGGYCTEIAGSEIGADAGAAGASLAWTSELRVVPGVEALGTELDAAAAIFVQGEFFKQWKIPVVAARPAKSVKAEIAPGSRGRSSKRGSVKPRADRLGIRDIADEIGPIQDITRRKEARDVGTADAKVQRRSRLRSDYAGQFPSANRRLQ